MHSPYAELCQSLLFHYEFGAVALQAADIDAGTQVGNIDCHLVRRRRYVDAAYYLAGGVENLHFRSDIASQAVAHRYLLFSRVRINLGQNALLNGGDTHNGNAVGRRCDAQNGLVLVSENIARSIEV